MATYRKNGQFLFVKRGSMNSKLNSNLLHHFIQLKRVTRGKGMTQMAHGQYATVCRLRSYLIIHLSHAHLLAAAYALCDPFREETNNDHAWDCWLGSVDQSKEASINVNYLVVPLF